MEAVFDNVHRQNDFYMMTNKKHIMVEDEDEAGNDWEEHFDADSSGTKADEETDTIIAEQTSGEKENTYPQEAILTQLIKEAVTPLRVAVETLTEVYIEEPQWCIDLSTLGRKLIRSIPGESSHKRGANAISDDRYNLSALQFQAAMLQPCNGQVLPTYVRDEIERLYAVERRYAIAIRAQRALKLIVECDPVMLKLPEDPDEQLLLMEVVNEWYTREYPERKPLTIKPLES